MLHFCSADESTGPWLNAGIKPKACRLSGYQRFRHYLQNYYRLKYFGWKGLMLNKFLFEQTNLPLLYKGLDTYSLRQKASAHNIANINTHGYRRMEVKFEDELRKAMKIDPGVTGKITDPGHFKIGANRIEDVEPVPYMPLDEELHSGINNVDIDEEMVRLAKAQLSFDFASRMANRTFRGLRSSIRGEVSS